MEASIIERANGINSEEAVIHAASLVTRKEAVVVNPIPYAGEEEVAVHDYEPLIDGGFWITKPA